ncbi:MAG TPA: hypothetical protein VFT55_18040, partial [Planctomycetota bacterium]|nr:hypothetical protein [Planctomycetota bacterium]
MSETPKDSTSAVVMMPECGDLIRLVFGKSSLELHRTGASGADVTCGSWSAMYPGPFTARAFGPNDIVVAMRTGNAGPQTTVLRLVRAGPAADFELAAIAAVNQVEWVEAQGTVASAAAPHGGDAIVWQAGSGTVTMLFAWEGVPRVVVADVPLASMTPPAPVAGSGRRSRQSVLGPPQISVKGECLGEGIGAAALDVDGELHVFAR